MIEVRRLTKQFGNHPAVDDISLGGAPRGNSRVFRPQRGGKSTTMRMIAGFLPPTSGTALIVGGATSPQIPSRLARKSVICLKMRRFTGDDRL